MRTVLILLTLAALPASVGAQGVTTGTIGGTVRANDGSTISGARVHIRNTSNGQRWEVVTSHTGRYLVEALAVGGPYIVEARAVGFAPATKSGVLVGLGQRVVADFTLEPAAVELPAVIVTGDVHPALDPGRSGPAERVSRETIAALPNPKRDFLTLTLLSPHVSFSASSGGNPSGGISVGGQNRLYNNFQIDGGVHHDVYQGRLPGRETLPRPISLEAIEDVQVLAAPFDVRHGGFAGGLVNAVTRSGTNTVHGSVVGFLANGMLGGKGMSESRPDFTTWQYGGWIGGPIVRDRAHYFISIDLQRRIVPDPGPLLIDTVDSLEIARVRISHANAVRFQQILRTRYRLDPGSLGPSDERAPAKDVFGKVTLQLGTNNHLQLSHHYADGDRRTLLERRIGFYELSSAAVQRPSSIHASRIIWNHLLSGRFANQLILSYLGSHDECLPTASYPRIDVQVDQGSLMVGPPLGCPGTSASQDVVQLSWNTTVAIGSHMVSVGWQGEVLQFEDGTEGLSAGWWSFQNLDSLEEGTAFHHERTIPGPSPRQGVGFGARQIALHMQDRWNPTSNLMVTAGIRLDALVLPDAVPTNVALNDALGFDTSQLPSPSVLWSPRFGFNYEAGGHGRTFIRGGIGLFGGRMPYRWLGNHYRDDGTRMLFLICDGAQVPPFDPINQPTTCGNGPTARVSFVDENLKLPQNLKIALGVDHELLGGVIGTIDLLHTRAIHQLYVQDVNLSPPSGVARGEADRPLYGTIDSRGIARPNRVNPSLGQIVRVSNGGRDLAWSLTTQLRKRLPSGGELSALYAHTRARDHMSILAFAARPNLTGTPLDGTHERRRLTTSFFETPHRVLVNASMRLPYKVRLSLLFAGASGTPFTYVIGGDANADGIGRGAIRNDIIYVPKNVAPGGDISLVQFDNILGWIAAHDSVYARFERFIQEETCLREQRGRIMARNSCRNPWFGTVNASVTKAFPTLKGQSLELTVYAYNVLNLIHAEWGRSRLTSAGPWVTALRLTGYDAEAGRGIYELAPVGRNEIQVPESRWQLEVSGRYVF